MNMNKLIGLVLLAGGIVLVIYGISASDSFTSDVSRFFTGSPTDKAIWMTIAGIAAIMIGLFWSVAVLTKMKPESFNKDMLNKKILI